MGPTEYRLLEFFMSHQERAYSRTQLLDQVWGANVYVEDRTIDVHIRRLRKALAPTALTVLSRRYEVRAIAFRSRPPRRAEANNVLGFMTSV